MNIEFIAHAGFCVESQGYQILLDPWFTASDFNNPVLKSILPPHQTIDYMIPEPVKTVDQFRPHAILISHFHTHHSNLQDLRNLIEQSPECIIACCKLPTEAFDRLEAVVKGISSKAQIVALGPLQSFRLGSMQLVAIPHCHPHHTGWLVQTEGKKFLHLADSPINRNWWDRRIDPIYLQLKGLNPDLFAVTAAGQTWRNTRDGEKVVHENCAMGPYEAARLAQHLGARAAAVMGIFNFSIWKNRLEFTLPSALAESQFSWGLKHVAPSCQILTLRPGCQIYFDAQGSKTSVIY